MKAPKDQNWHRMVKRTDMEETVGRLPARFDPQTAALMDVEWVKGPQQFPLA